VVDAADDGRQSKTAMSLSSTVDDAGCCHPVLWPDPAALRRFEARFWKLVLARGVWCCLCRVWRW